MNWLLILETFIYVVIVILVCLKIIGDTRSVTKTFAYVLFVVFVPVVGILFYFFFGNNYRNKKIYSKRIFEGTDLAEKLREKVYLYSKKTIQENKEAVQANKELAMLLLKDIGSPLTPYNSVKILLNGENKFPEVLEVLRSAKHHIHIEYYIYEDDEIGREIENILIQKVAEGVQVRFIYDDFGSRSIRKTLARRLREGNVSAFPFYKINYIAFANRINYRNHRKIIVVDGITGFVGGVNISDRYINGKNKDQLFWRDTHLRIDGPGVQFLQNLFVADWNFCANKRLQPTAEFFPGMEVYSKTENKIVQIAAGGPDSQSPTILYSILQAINLATKEILITTPYFIPGESLMDALSMAALSGIKVKLLVPGVSDSKLVNAASRAYYGDLLRVGVDIYLYWKGFVHAKTLVADNKIAIVGTANMDIRSFDLNFEVNALVYDTEIAMQLSDIFYQDLEHAEKIDPVAWNTRRWHHQLWEKFVRLFSPLM
ncbi:MAG: cardiolipin synthase [Ginsengibacter sp.]